MAENGSLERSREPSEPQTAIGADSGALARPAPPSEP
jgi:hypothetical protein